MKILVIYPWDISTLVLQNNGAGRRVGSLVTFLVEQGHFVEVVSFGLCTRLIRQGGATYRQFRAPLYLFYFLYWGASFLLGRYRLLPLKLYLVYALYEKFSFVRTKLKSLANDFDVVFLEYPYAFKALESHAKKLILTDHDILFQTWWSGWQGRLRWLQDKLMKKEFDALSQSRFAVVVSPSDCNFFESYLTRHLEVIENPLVISSNTSLNHKSLTPTCFFVGSGWFPNLDAARFINEQLAPLCPEISFTVAGECCREIRQPRNNVRLLGVIDNDLLEQEYLRNSIAILPLFSGTGTSLKALEAMGRGMVIVTTETGVRGVPFVDGHHGFIAETPCEFRAAIRRSLREHEMGMNMQSAARDLAMQYDYRSRYKPYLDMIEIINFEHT